MSDLDADSTSSILGCTDYSGVNDAPSFPGSTLQTGAASSGREIPPEEGGDVVLETGATKASNPADNPRGATTGNVTTQRLTKADEFEGEVGEGPEAKRERYENERGGEDDVRGNVR